MMAGLSACLAGVKVALSNAAMNSCRANYLLRIFPGFLLLTLLLSGCHTPPAATASRSSAPGIDVYLIPLDDFSFEYTDFLARSLSKETGLRIKPCLQMGATGLVPFPGTSQYSAAAIMNMAAPVTANLPYRRADTAYIVLTSRDINMDSRALHFVFTIHNSGMRIAVVSAARLFLSQAGGVADRETVNRRIIKMVKRSIGDVYYGYQRSTDIHDLMYSPIMSLEDVDKMGNVFLNRK